MKVALINKNPAVSRLVTMSLSDIGIECRLLKEVSELDEKFDYIIVDSDVDVYNNTNLNDFAPCVMALMPRGFDTPSFANLMLEKPFLPMDFISVFERSLKDFAPQKSQSDTNLNSDFSGFNKEISLENSENFSLPNENLDNEILNDEAKIDESKNLNDEINLDEFSFDEPIAIKDENFTNENSDIISQNIAPELASEPNIKLSDSENFTNEPDNIENISSLINEIESMDEASEPELESAISEPESVISEPEIAMSESATPEPEVAMSEPEVAVNNKSGFNELNLAQDSELNNDFSALDEINLSENSEFSNYALKDEYKEPEILAQNSDESYDIKTDDELNLDDIKFSDEFDKKDELNLDDIKIDISSENSAFNEPSDENLNKSEIEPLYEPIALAQDEPIKIEPEPIMPAFDDETINSEISLADEINESKNEQERQNLQAEITKKISEYIANLLEQSELKEALKNININVSVNFKD